MPDLVLNDGVSMCRHGGFGYRAASGISMRSEATGVLLAVAMFGHAAHAAMAPEAARFPEKPIRIIVPFAPGGGTDFIARLAGQKIIERWGQPVIIDNRPGASATIGTEIVAKATADGYTFGIINAEHTIVPSIYSKVPYHPIKDFAPSPRPLPSFMCWWCIPPFRPRR